MICLNLTPDEWPRWLSSRVATCNGRELARGNRGRLKPMARGRLPERRIGNGIVAAPPHPCRRWSPAMGCGFGGGGAIGAFLYEYFFGIHVLHFAGPARRRLRP